MRCGRTVRSGGRDFLAWFYPGHSKQLHTAHKHPVEVVVCYAFHPRYGEHVVVTGVKSFHGQRHYVIRQADETLTYLPEWMVRAEAESPSHLKSAVREIRMRRSVGAGGG